MRIAWLSADPVAEASLGVTDRSEGVRYLIGRGHEVTMITGGSPSSRAIPGVPTVFVRARYVPFLAWLFLWPGTWRALRRLPRAPDVVVSDFGLLPVVMRWVRTLRKEGRPAPRVLLDVRSHPVEAGRVRLAAQRARFAMTLRRYGPRVDGITTISPGLREHVARLARVRPDAIEIWTSGCSWCDRPTPVQARPPEWPSDLRDRLVIVYHGMLSPGRGLLEAVRAVGIARAEAPEVALVLLGSGPGRPGLERTSAHLGLEDHVRFLDPVPHDRVPEFLAMAQVGLAPWPATWDMEVNCPLKLTEYLCVGLPVVVTDITPHRILPADAPFAFWATAATPDDLAAAMIRAARSRSNLRALGQEAAAWAGPRLGWSRQFAIMEGRLRALAVGAPTVTSSLTG